MKILYAVLFVAMLLSFTGCGGNTELEKAKQEAAIAKAQAQQAQTELQKNEQQSDLEAEYTNYVDDVNNAASEAQDAMTKWNTLMDQHNQGSDISIDDLKTAKSDYERAANKLAPKIDALLAFIEKNNDKLLGTGSSKDEIFKEKSELNDLKAEITTNKEQMKEEYEKIESEGGEEGY